MTKYTIHNSAAKSVLSRLLVYPPLPRLYGARISPWNPQSVNIVAANVLHSDSQIQIPQLTGFAIQGMSLKKRCTPKNRNFTFMSHMKRDGAILLCFSFIPLKIANNTMDIDNTKESVCI